MDKIFYNKCTFGKANFGTHIVSKANEDYNGIYTVYASLDKSIGTEVILYIRDETDFIYDIAKVRPFELYMKSGIVRTEYGPLLILLFYIPDPRFEGRPFTMFDIHLNPFEPQHLGMFYDLSRQSHWHLFLLNKENEQAEFFEFDNTYGLYEALQTVEDACRGMKSIDFWKAKEKFVNQYLLEDLYNM